MPVSVPQLLLFACACTAAALPARAQSISEKRVELLFRPTVGERMALSPDGQYLAYTRHANGILTILVMDLERLETKSRIEADEDRPLLHSKEKQRAELRFMEWAPGNRLVFAPTIEVIAPSVTPSPESGLAPLEPIVIAPIMAVDADGGNPRELLNAKQFQYVLNSANPGEVAGRVRTGRPEIRGFVAGDRDHLLIEVRGTVSQGVPTEMHRLNVQTGKLSRLNESMTSARVIYDQQGRARLNTDSDRFGTTTDFIYRAVDGGRWGKLPEPAGSDAGAHFTRTADTFLGERLIALGFDFDPNVLIYASNAGRDTFGIYGLDLTTRRRTSLILENPHRDLIWLWDEGMPSASLVFDKFRERLAGVRAFGGTRALTVWVDPELADIQRTLEGKFPQRSIRLLEWNEARTRFLLQVTGGTEPGRTCLFQRPEGVVVELMRRAPWLPNAELHHTQLIEFPGPDGSALSGYLTLPRTPRLNPPPLIVWFAPGLPAQTHPEFDPQAQVLADMGFVVCRLNQRGVLGFGAKHRDALRRDPDGATAADALAAIEWIAARHRIDRKRIATLGEGFAGHLALRVTQVRPEIFRCAVLIDPVINLASWVQRSADAVGPPSLRQEISRRYLEGGGAKLANLSTTAHANELNAPVFFITRSANLSPDGMMIAAGVDLLRSQLKRRDIPHATADYAQDYTLGLPAARTRVYRQLEEFFNLNLYNYDVKIGPTKVIK